ncbi:MAG: cytidylate kinase [Alteromonadaceae bacterium]|nr:MAG: cytidylate kinase [Alteromonadaceae bacterium]
MNLDAHSVPVLTIDGPSGAGKGTICRMVAQATGFSLLDSGALYRLTALACLNGNIDLMSEVLAAEQAECLDVAFKVVGDGTQVLLSGEDVGSIIREERVGMAASKIAAYPKLRAALLDRQRAFRAEPGLVADGRDMGTVVFPDATSKIFLTASADARAHRRVSQLVSLGQAADFEKILADIVARDKQDTSRASAPLIAADDALIVDCTSLSIQQVFDAVMETLPSCQPCL